MNADPSNLVANRRCARRLRSTGRTSAWRQANGRVALCVASLVVVVALANRLAAQAPVAEDASPRVATEPPAAAVEQGQIPHKNLWAIARAGGVLMIPIAGCSFISLVFAFERAITLRRGRVIPKPFVKRFLHKLHEGQLDREQALLLCEESGSPVANVFAHGVRKWGRPAVEVEQAILDGGERAVNGLRRYVRVFNGVSTISPLLGLLGTVFGMINAFNEIAGSDAMGKPELLASGISEALITTAAGLCVAIPSLAAYLFFIGRVDQLVMEIDALGQEVVSAISAEGLNERAQPRTSRAAKREAA